MDILQFANNANTTVASPINTLATSVSVLTGTGVLFPIPAAGFSFIATFTDAATKSITEIVRVTAKTGDTFTIQRGQEGTVPQSWIAGDLFEMLPTAATMAAFSQIPQTQASAYNVGVDTGGVNNLVVAFTPAITQHIQGLTLRIKAANSNTGACTLNAGPGSAPLVNPDGSALGAGAIISGGYIEVIDDAVNSRYQLISASQQAQSTAGAATTGDMKFRPTSETISGWVIANATTIGNASSNATQRANADTANLFAWHWNNFPNTQCQVFTSAGVPTTRGANAAADFAANKQMQVFDKRAIGETGVDGMGNVASGRLAGVPVSFGSVSTPGSLIGENLHALIAAENAAHNHGYTDGGHVHQEIGFIANGVGGAGFHAYDAFSLGNAGLGTSGTLNTGSATTGIVISSSGSGTAHNNLHLSYPMYYYIKL